MIYLYNRRVTGDLSAIKAKLWLESYSIPYKLLYPKNLTPKLIMKMFRASENIDEILLSQIKGVKTWDSVNLTSAKLQELTTKELTELLLKKPSLLKSPIIFDKNKLISGYNQDEIRVFFTKRISKTLQKIRDFIKIS